MFENILDLGPAIAINGTDSLDKHIQFILDKGYIPLEVITNKEHGIFKLFEDKEDKENFKTVAVIITVQYKKAYE